MTQRIRGCETDFLMITKLFSSTLFIALSYHYQFASGAGSTSCDVSILSALLCGAQEQYPARLPVLLPAYIFYSGRSFSHLLLKSLLINNWFASLVSFLIFSSRGRRPQWGSFPMPTSSWPWAPDSAPSAVCRNTGSTTGPSRPKSFR